MNDSEELLHRLAGIGILPLRSISSPEEAVSLAGALCRGGIPVLILKDAPEEVFSAIRKSYPGMMLGSTGPMHADILLSEQDHIMTVSGRTFHVLPSGLIPWGNAVPSEQKGFSFTLLNQPAYFGILSPAIAANTDTAETAARNAVHEMLGLHISHIGINCSEAEGAQTAEQFADLFLGTVSVTGIGYFGSPMAEIMVRNQPGTHGHIGIGVHSADRALAYYRAIGYAFIDQTAVYEPSGELARIYFRDPVGGFAIHLMKD
ncbi:MAG: hypothetical protein ACI4WR_01000 [Bulleidia sp.]